QQRSLLEILELHFQHADPSALGRYVIRKWIVGKRPSMPFSPEAVHESVDELDLRITVELRRQCPNQLFERFLKNRMIISRLVFGVRVPQIPLCRTAALLVTEHQIDFRNPLQHKI